MKLGLCTIAFQEKPLEEVIDIAADHGFDGIELWGKPPHLPEDYDESYAKNVRDMAQRKGLVISALGSYVDPLMHLHQRHFEAAFKIAHDLGTDLVRIWSGGGASKSITAADQKTSDSLSIGEYYAVGKFPQYPTRIGNAQQPSHR